MEKPLSVTDYQFHEVSTYPNVNLLVKLTNKKTGKESMMIALSKGKKAYAEVVTVENNEYQTNDVKAHINSFTGDGRITKINIFNLLRFHSQDLFKGFTEKIESEDDLKEHFIIQKIIDN